MILLQSFCIYAKKRYNMWIKVPKKNIFFGNFSQKNISVLLQKTIAKG